MKVKAEVKNQEVQQADGKQVKINEGTRKHTLSIYEQLVSRVQTCWGLDFDVDAGSKAVSDLLYQYDKKEGKQAVKLILEDDMEVFKDQKKAFRIYAQKILNAGREMARDRIKENNEVVEGIIKRSEKMAADLAVKDKTPHPMGKGMQRIKNEVANRPRFMMEDVKFRFLRTIGVY
jgi:hypothetical protein